MSREKNEGYRKVGLGEKIPPNFFYFFMFFRMVSALRPWAMSILAICCEYQISDFPGFLFQLTIFFLPGLVHGLGLQLAGLALDLAWRVAVVCRGRGIHHPADHGAIKRIFTVAKFNQLGQRHRVFPATKVNTPLALQA